MNARVNGRTTFRLPAKTVNALNRATGDGDKGMFIRACVGAQMIRGVAVTPVTRVAKRTVAVTIDVSWPMFVFWRSVARHQGNRCSVDQLVTAALDGVLMAA